MILALSYLSIWASLQNSSMKAILLMMLAEQLVEKYMANEKTINE